MTPPAFDFHEYSLQYHFIVKSILSPDLRDVILVPIETLVVLLRSMCISVFLTQLVGLVLPGHVPITRLHLRIVLSTAALIRRVSKFSFYWIILNQNIYLKSIN